MQDIVLISIPETTIRNIVEEAVEEAVKKALANHHLSKTEVQSQVVDLNGLLIARPSIGSKSTIYKKISKGLIPHSKQGKKLFFDLKVIDAWLLENKVKTTAERTEEVRSRRGKRNRR